VAAALQMKVTGPTDVLTATYVSGPPTNILNQTNRWSPSVSESPANKQAILAIFLLQCWSYWYNMLLSQCPKPMSSRPALKLDDRQQITVLIIPSALAAIPPSPPIQQLY